MAKQCTTGFVGNGTVEVYPWNGKLEPDKKLVTLEAHTMNCLCIKFDPRDKYFAVGSASRMPTLFCCTPL